MASDLKEDLAKGKPVFGVRNTVKKLKHSKLRKVYIASNCKEKESIARYCQMFGAEAVMLEETNAQIGVICKRPHLISVLSFE